MGSLVEGVLMDETVDAFGLERKELRQNSIQWHDESYRVKNDLSWN